MPLIVWLAACAAAPEPAPSPLVFVSEASGRPVAVSGGRPLAGLPGATFPVARDPAGPGFLLIASEDGPGGHLERLWLTTDGDPRPLGPPAEIVRNPTWSADGASVVFESSANSYRDLYRIGRDGGEPQRLTDAPNGSFEPDLAPDGTIAFGTSRDGNAEIWRMAADGSDPRRLTDHPSDDLSPRWSPDGATLAWRAARDGRPRVWTMSADGADPRPLRPAPVTPAVDLAHTWSPDARRLAVVVQTGPQDVAIEVFDVATRARIGTLDGPGVDEHPVFSPDGARIAFTSTREGQADVWTAAPDGGDLRRETSDPAPEWLPRWR